MARTAGFYSLEENHGMITQIACEGASSADAFGNMHVAIKSLQTCSMAKGARAALSQ